MRPTICVRVVMPLRPYPPSPVDAAPVTSAPAPVEVIDTTPAASDDTPTPVEPSRSEAESDGRPTTSPKQLEEAPQPSEIREEDRAETGDEDPFANPVNGPLTPKGTPDAGGQGAGGYVTKKFTSDQEDSNPKTVYDFSKKDHGIEAPQSDSLPNDNRDPSLTLNAGTTAQYLQFQQNALSDPQGRRPETGQRLPP